jgi:adenylate cyclase
VRDYVELATAAFPDLVAALGAVLSAHMVSVARGAWTTDDERSSITRQLAVGFVDLVGYTTRSATLSPGALAATLVEFEHRVGELVGRAGGRVVKLIGDEAMFVVDDAAAACDLALELATTFDADTPVRVGLAVGPVVGLHGDYYGEVVNLAARLVKLATPSTVVTSAALSDSPSCAGRFAFEPQPVVAVKGFDHPVATYVLGAGATNP